VHRETLPVDNQWPDVVRQFDAGVRLSEVF
jgi:hypothetical protein